MAPFDRALDLAHQGREYIRSEIRDYTAIMIKRERHNGTLGEPEFMSVKIRNRQPEENIPFSIYMKFLKPASIKGREVIWVEGQNENNLIAHDNGVLTGRVTAHLDPDGFIRHARQPLPDL